MTSTVKINQEMSSDIEIERQLIAGLLYKPSLFDGIYSILPNGEYFYYTIHGIIYDKIIKLANNNQPFDVNILRQYFKANEELEDLDGDQYLSDIVNNLISTVNAPNYAKTLKDLHLERKIKELCCESIEKLEYDNDDSDPQSVLSSIESKLDKINSSNDFSGGSYDMDDCVDDALQNITNAQKGLLGLKTGLVGVDNRIKGLQKGNLYVMAGRPGMGKTALALTIATNIAKAGNIPLFFSLEMTKGQLTQRIVARYSGVPVSTQDSIMNDSDYQKVINVSDDIKALPMVIDDTSALHINQIRMRAKAQVRKSEINCVIIDYLGLVRATNQNAQKVHQIEEITQSLKAMAKDLNLPVILLGQLSRAVEQRDDKRPMLSDLRDSGSIEQDADVVIFIYRQEYYEKSQEPQRKTGDSDSKFNQKIIDWNETMDNCRGKADILIVKNRQGQSGTETVKFNGRKQEFCDE